MNAISLFSSSGIGDLGLRVNGINTVIANEILADRAKLFQYNYPETKMFVGDIWDVKEDIINYYTKNYQNPPFLIIATPPCQGMSPNGLCQVVSGIKFTPKAKLSKNALK